jgi:hypothetical protein
MAFDFLKDATNAILVGPNGVGKSTLARNIAHQALIHGRTVLFTSAGALLGELAALDSDSALRRRLRHSRANPIASRRPANDPSSAHANDAKPSDAKPSHDQGHEQSLDQSAAHHPLPLPAYWTPEQACAVVELLDDLRDRIWAHYGVQLFDQYREQYGPTDGDHTDDTTDNPSL